MRIRKEIVSDFPKPAQVVWDCLIFFRSCEKWVAPDDLNGFALLVDSGRYVGFQWDLGDGMDPIQSFVQSIDFGRSVSYKTVHATKSNVPPNSRAFFPFLSITQSTTLSNTGNGCRSMHEIEFEPNGVMGWLMCKLFVAPQVAKSVLKYNRQLSAFLKAG